MKTIIKKCPECGSLNLIEIKDKSFKCVDCGLNFIKPREVEEKLDFVEALCWGGIAGSIVEPLLKK